MVNTRITKERMRHHFSYGVWKYVLLAVLAIFGWDLIYSMTAYRPPADKKLDIYIVSPGADVNRMREDLLEPLQAVFPDQEAFSFLYVALDDDREPNAVMQFTTYIGAMQGDVFLLSMGLYRQYGSALEDGLFLQLDEAIASGQLSIEGMDIESVRFEDGDGIYGIPAKTLYGLTDYMINNEHMVLAIPAYSGNAENAIQLISFLVERFSTEKPGWYDEYQQEIRRQQQEQQMLLPP
ncbi:MAG: hypothetical protein FWD25_07925 [Clostridia bacterium]|nr:hypothetical protein [Clostridia bacterium]